MDKISKFLGKLSKKELATILIILSDIRALNLEQYDVKALKGKDRLFRLRKGKIRIIFKKQDSKGILVKIAFRKDAY